MLLIRNIFRALKHHMLEKMSKPAPALLFKCASNMVGNIYVTDRIAVVLVNYYVESIGKFVTLVGDHHLVTGLFYFFYKYRPATFRVLRFYGAVLLRKQC